MSNAGQPTIRRNDTGEPVRRLQRALDRSGPGEPLQVDGQFGATTENFVKYFQEDNGLTVDGVVGPATWAALPNGAPMPVLQQGSRGAVVASLQRLLQALAPDDGVSPGSADGVFGTQTRAAVVAFQRQQDLPADGIVGDQTWGTSLHAAGQTLEKAVGLDYAEA
jgi:peptidoglycan hydrolase-like protein with peptidoglycan-binding domain